ncbi:helix-turn-helix domain-containing protein [Desulfotruncus alcoholivorax]|uniref:helix-turn-helix domain-containing protein n=1 Tax=Desulfotruncus alcoholivorax TaxID=265477 RepID=UPI0003FACFED|nr:XRE family transcriptional regulator [Desulfotruncus alcoholivorax]
MLKKVTNEQDKKFNPEMLVIGRESRALTQKDLANRLGVNQGWLSRIESNLRPISDEIVEQFSNILGYPVEFFYQTDMIYGFGPSELFNRKRQDIPVKKLQTIHAQLNLRRMQLTRLLRDVDICEVNIPIFDLMDFDNNIENIAKTVRALWHIPPGPIANLSRIIEDNGGIIIPFDFGTPRIDAISLALPKLPPLFFININYPGDRMRFTLSHELAHIIMHQKDPNPNMEKEADRFSAEFLMPAKEIRPYLRNLSIQRLAELKIHWKVSMAALLKRAADLGEITERQYRFLWMKMSKLGYKTKEPLEIPKEVPTLFQEIIDVYRNELGYTAKELSKKLNLMEQETRQIYFNNNKLLKIIK